MNLDRAESVMMALVIEDVHDNDVHSCQALGVCVSP